MEKMQAAITFTSFLEELLVIDGYPFFIFFPCDNFETRIYAFRQKKVFFLKKDCDQFMKFFFSRTIVLFNKGNMSSAHM